MNYFRIAAFAAGLADWPHYGNDPGGMRHSPLTDVTPANVSRLKVAWTYRTGDIVDGRIRSSFQATPLLIDGTLFIVTPVNRIIALNPETGQERWKFDPQIERKGDYGDGLTCRGLASFRDPSTGKVTLYVATQDGRLIAVAASDGRKLGESSLTTGIEQKYRGEYHFTSPPAVVRDTVVVGSAINDNNRANMPSGVVRGFDARTLALKWSFHPMAGVNAGAGNAWSILSADSERDLVFLPTGSASPDFFGGHRPGDNRYANSTVALRGSTGEVVWHFQTVHHDLWDYDVSAQPVLLTVKINGTPRAAVAQATKMGHIFLLDRDTGKPLFPVVERPVPASDIPEERASPTQPFPTMPPPISKYTLKPEDAWGLTFYDRGKCRDLIASARNDGVFTPPSTRGTIMFPGNIGGANWGSLSYDAARDIAVVGDARLPFYVRLYKRDQLQRARKQFPEAEFARMDGTPYIMMRFPLMSPWKMPCIQPPWGVLHGVELSTGKVRWSVPLGTPRDLTPLPLNFQWGTPFVSGAMTTASGLTFIGAAMDFYLRAFDTSTGKEVWKHRLPTSAQAVPMTYRAREGGKQYIVVSVGGHAKMPMPLGDHLIAFALP